MLGWNGRVCPSLRERERASTESSMPYSYYRDPLAVHPFAISDRPA